MKRIEKTEEQWRSELSEEEFAICRQQGTERAFSGEYHDCKKDGVYRCRCCGTELFAAANKYDSKSGWPSFWQPAAPEHVETKIDNQYGMSRTEVVCTACDAHLGHVFEDGPEPTGQRYCINSLSLRLDESSSGD